MNILRRLSLAVGFLLLIVAYQNCYQMQGVDLGSDNGLGTDVTKVECQFVTVDTLSSIIVNQLGIVEGDVSILNGGDYLNQYQNSLGAADAEAGQFGDGQCTALKYKITTQLMVDACMEGFSREPEEGAKSASERLFPNGVNDYDALYLTFLGRLPNHAETSILDELVANMSSDKAEAAVCAAVAGSFEALTRN